MVCPQIEEGIYKRDPKTVIISLKMYKLGVVAFYSAQGAVANRSLWVPGWSGLHLFLKKKKKR